VCIRVTVCRVGFINWSKNNGDDYQINI